MVEEQSQYDYMSYYSQYSQYYIPQYHHCYFAIEVDRLLLENQKLTKEVAEHKDCANILYSKCADYEERIQKKRLREQIKSFRKKLRKQNMLTQETIVPAISKDSQDLLFDIFKNLRNLEDIVQLKHSKLAQDKRLLQSAKFVKLRNTFDVVEDLNNMIGMENVKTKAFHIICFYTQQNNNQQNGSKDLMHIVLDGGPGVGKTVVAKHLAKLFLALGMLKKTTFVEATRRDLIGQYLGDTIVKTQRVIDEARGGVLFIDEAYSLGHADKRDSFNSECINCLNYNLTNRKGEFLCIIAGYEEELKNCFFALNPGLESRFPEAMRMHIEKYSAEQLYEIACFMMKTNHAPWKFAGDSSKMIAIFKTYHAQMKYYGRDVENVLTEAKMLASTRLMRTTIQFDKDPEITCNDLEKACKICFTERLPKSDCDFYV